MTKHIIVATDNRGNEAMYVGGDLTPTKNHRVRASEIMSAADKHKIHFSHFAVNRRVETWPNKFEELLTRMPTIADMKKQGGGICRACGFLYLVTSSGTVYEIASFGTTKWNYYPEPKPTTIDDDYPVAQGFN